MAVFNEVEEAINAIKKGEIVVVMDDENRENEGDLIMAAQFATPEKLALFIRYTTGIICAPMLKENADRLALPNMVLNNNCPKRTAFTVTCDAKKVGTGVSAKDRSLTLKLLANCNAVAEDFHRPGHIFPLIARPGGVLERGGHTEASVDLMLLAGVTPVSVISELTHDDGRMMRLDACSKFAQTHSLKLITVEAIITYRQIRNLQTLTDPTVVSQKSNEHEEKKTEDIEKPIKKRKLTFQGKKTMVSEDGTCPSQINDDRNKGIRLSIPAKCNIKNINVGIVRTCWNESFVLTLVNNAKSVFVKSGILEKNIQEFSVPGCYELPFAALQLANTGSVDVIICLGVLLKNDGTLHFECVAKSVSQAIMQVQLSTGVPVLYGVLNCLNLEQAKQKVGKNSSLPQSLAMSALHMADFKRKMKYQSIYQQFNPPNLSPPLIQPCSQN